MTRQLIFIYSVLTLFTFCGQTEKQTTSIPKIDNLSIDGYWIMTNYLDKINETKSIEPQVRQHRLAWDAIILKVERDSIETHGLIMKTKVAFSKNVDSFTTLIGMGNYRLNFDKTDNSIYAVDLSGVDTVRYKFRKIKDNEKRLVENIDGKPFFEQLSLNFYNYFIETFISGTFRPLSKSKSTSTLNLLTNGKMNGFKNFDEYSIHDYFGTLHPFPGDAIIFTDTKKEIKENQPPDNSEVYKWEFKNDTLILTEYLTEDFENYKLGKAQYVFIRQ